MAKRVRGSSTRPGQRAPLQRSGARPAPSRPASTAEGTSATAAGAGATASPTRPASLTPEEEARAAEIEAQILAEEKAATEAARRTRERARRASVEPTVRSGTISMRAADEYAYVVRDVRRIVVIGGSLVALLLGLWVVVEATGIGPF